MRNVVGGGQQNPSGQSKVAYSSPPTAAHLQSKSASMLPLVGPDAPMPAAAKSSLNSNMNSHRSLTQLKNMMLKERLNEHKRWTQWKESNKGAA